MFHLVVPSYPPSTNVPWYLTPWAASPPCFPGRFFIYIFLCSHGGDRDVLRHQRYKRPKYLGALVPGRLTGIFPASRLFPVFGGNDGQSWNELKRSLLPRRIYLTRLPSPRPFRHISSTHHQTNNSNNFLETTTSHYHYYHLPNSIHFHIHSHFATQPTSAAQPIASAAIPAKKSTLFKPPYSKWPPSTPWLRSSSALPTCLLAPARHQAVLCPLCPSLVKWSERATQ